MTVVEDNESQTKEHQSKQESPQAQVDATQLTCSSSPEEPAFINVNRRHQRDFNKHKSSAAMRTLLMTDVEQLKKKEMVQAEREARSRLGLDQRSERSNSREASRGRASSRWRQGVTQSSLERHAQDSARKEVDLKANKMQYPSWWQGADEIQEQQARGHHEPPVVNQAKAKVHKTLNRYAEDSLDARLRQVQQNVPQETVINLSHQTPNVDKGLADSQGQFSSIDLQQNKQSFIGSQTHLLNSL